MNETTPQKILDAALTLVRDRGYHALTMDEIAASAGVSKGALYWHYESKKGLFLHLIDHWVDLLSGDITRTLRESNGSGEALANLCDLFISQFKVHRDVFEAETEFWSLAHRDDDARARVEKVYGEFLDTIERVIRDGMEVGEFHLKDPHLAALTLLVNLESGVWFTLFSPNSVNYGTYMKYFKEHFLGLLTEERRQP